MSFSITNSSAIKEINMLQLDVSVSSIKTPIIKQTISEVFQSKEDSSSLLTKDLLETLDDSFESSEKVISGKSLTVIDISLDSYLKSAFTPEQTQSSGSLPRVSGKNILVNYQNEHSKGGKSQSSLFHRNTPLRISNEPSQSSVKEDEAELIDDYFTIQDGKPGWICSSCSNFNFESTVLI